MENIYVTGHRNPDTDSIVAAIAYTALQNALGHREYVAARLGHLSDETKLILERFGFPAPLLIKNMRTQVKDLEYDTPPALHRGLTVSRGWSILQSDSTIAAIPVTNETGELFGMLSSGDIASYDMRSISDPMVRQIPLFNLLSVLEGRVLNEAGNDLDAVSGELVFALPKGAEQPMFTGRDVIAICGNQPETIRMALAANINCLILCEAELDPELRAMDTKTCIISTPFDAYRAARLVFQAVPIERICRTHDLQSFHLEDYLDDVKDVVSQSRYRCYPILDENEKVVGTLPRYHLIKPRRKKVVLVDHNEVAQSVPGLDQAEILGIIDHHRLADIQTLSPIFFRNDIVGSTNTILAGMFQEKGLMPHPKLAGLMCAAILSDTVMFKSPTATQRDRDIAERLARIAGVSLEKLGQEIFSASVSESKSADSLFHTDFKDFHIAGHYLGVSQITCVDSTGLLKRKDEFIKVMQQEIADKGYSMMILMLTDVLKEGTQLIYLGNPDDIAQAFNVEVKSDSIFLPGVMSRKKQVIPSLSALWG